MLFQNKIARFKLDPPKLADKTYIYEWISFKNMIILDRTKITNGKSKICF